jgi:hypothetical protein
VSEVEKLVEEWRKSAINARNEALRLESLSGRCSEEIGILTERQRDTAAEYDERADELQAAIAADKQAQPSGEVSDEVVREVAVAINASWTGVEGSPRGWWARLGSNERKHKDRVARAAIAAYHAALTAASKGEKP